jgi:malate dehydrogenase (oxaloacetate-decarboxylating)(NADP+)
VARRAINEEMKIAATLAIAALAHEPTSETAAQAYEGGVSSFGPESLIPNPFDQRLILRIAPAVARRRWKAACQHARYRISMPTTRS